MFPGSSYPAFGRLQRNLAARMRIMNTSEKQTRTAQVCPADLHMSCCCFYLLELLLEEVSDHIHDLGLIEVDSSVGSVLDIDELRGNAGFLQVLVQDLGLVD